MIEIRNIEYDSLVFFVETDEVFVDNESNAPRKECNYVTLNDNNETVVVTRHIRILSRWTHDEMMDSRGISKE